MGFIRALVGLYKVLHGLVRGLYRFLKGSTRRVLQGFNKGLKALSLGFALRSSIFRSRVGTLSLKIRLKRPGNLEFSV